MKHRNRTAIITAVAVSLTPVISQAATEAEALQACISAMTASLEQDNGAAIGVQIAEPSDNSSKLLHWETVFHLDAADAKTGETVAKVDCLVNSNARVMDLKQLSLTSDSAQRRSLTST